MNRAPRKVLVVDDERDLADLAEALLSSAGFQVRVAYSATEALVLLAADAQIDAMFSDVMMHGMTGLQLANMVEKLYPGTRIVLTSGYTSLALHGETGQPYRYVAKPYRIEQVVTLLRSQDAPGIG